MKKLKNLFLVLSAALLLVSCGSGLGGLNGDNQTTAPGSGNDNSGSNGGTDNGGDNGNNGGSGNGGDNGNNGGSDNEVIVPSDLKGTIWLGIYVNNYVGLKIKNDSELVYDQCTTDRAAIDHVKTEKEGTSFYRVFTYKKDGSKFTITGVKDGKDNAKGLKEFYIENGKLIIKDNNGTSVIKADLRESVNDAADKKYIFDEINRYRQSKGIDPISGKDNPCMVSFTLTRIKEIEQHFGHERPNGKPIETIFDEIVACKYSRPGAHGEIIGDNATAQGVMENWKKSEGHSGAMLGNFNHAVVEKSGRFWIVFFGKF